MGDERRPPRTDQGALLRSGIEMVKQIEVPPGKVGYLVVVTDLHDAMVGAALVTKGGVELKGAVSAAIRDGRALKVFGSVAW